MYVFLYIAVGFLLLSLILLYLRSILTHLASFISYVVTAFGIICMDTGPRYFIVSFLLLHLFYFLLVRYTARCYLFLIVKDRLDAEWLVFTNDFKVVPVDPNDYPDLDHEFYNSHTRFMEENGFDKIGDYSDNNFSQHLFIRSFTRYFLNKEHDISASIMHQLTKTVIIPIVYSVSINYRTVSFSTEFTDGMVFITSNTKGISVEVFDGFTINDHSPDTPIEELLKCHRESISKICEERGVKPRLRMTESDLFAASARKFALYRQMLLKEGGGNVGICHREIVESTDPNNRKLSFCKEYLKQARQRAEKERRKQGNNEF